MNQAHIEIVTRGVLPLEISQRWPQIAKVAESSLFTIYAVDALSFTLDDSHFLMLHKESDLVSDFNTTRLEQTVDPASLSWEERERINDQERLAYCGYED